MAKEFEPEDEEYPIGRPIGRGPFFTITSEEAIIEAYIDIPFKGNGWVKKIVPAARAEAWAKELLTYEDAPGAVSSAANEQEKQSDEGENR